MFLLKKEEKCNISSLNNILWKVMSMDKSAMRIWSVIVVIVLVVSLDFLFLRNFLATLMC